jgi:ABC-type transport system involved in multi-copper enzyme maturation permease subunit
MYMIRFPYLKKIWRDQRYVLLILVLFTALFEYLYAWVFFKSPVSSFIEAYFKFLPTEITSFLGVQAGTAFYHAQIIAFGYIHPLILISFSFFPISLPARYISGEIESKNFDIFFSRPVHRAVVPTHLFIFIAGTSAFLSMGIFTGTLIANFQFSLSLQIYDYARVAVTAFFFFLSLAALALTLASFQNDRGKALTKIIGLFVFLYFYDTITRLNEGLKPFYTFSYFKLYQPGEIIVHKVSVIPSILISLIIMVIFLTIAIIRFNRRDL